MYRGLGHVLRLKFQVVSSALFVGCVLATCVSASNGDHSAGMDDRVKKEAVLSDLIHKNVRTDREEIEEMLAQLDGIGGTAALCEGLIMIGTMATIDGDGWSASIYLKRALGSCEDKGLAVLRLAEASKGDAALCLDAYAAMREVNQEIDGSVGGRLGRAQNAMTCGDRQTLSEDIEWLVASRTAESFGAEAMSYEPYARNVIASYLNAEINNDTLADSHLAYAVEEFCRLRPSPSSVVSSVRKERQASIKYGFRLDALWLLSRVIKTDAVDLIDGDDISCLREVATQLEATFRATEQEEDQQLADLAEWVKTMLTSNRAAPH